MKDHYRFAVLFCMLMLPTILFVAYCLVSSNYSWWLPSADFFTTRGQEHDVIYQQFFSPFPWIQGIWMIVVVLSGLAELIIPLKPRDTL